MSILAPAPAPTLVEVAELCGITPWEAFTSGARIRTEADVLAVADSMPPMTPEEEADLAAWCAEVATWSVQRVAEAWQCGMETAAHLRDLMAGGIR